MAQSAQELSEPSPPKRRRVQKACSFCRQRKLKCDNSEPKCSNCKAYGRECSYTSTIEKPRPTNSRIQHLEQENERLQAQLQKSISSNASSRTLSPSQNRSVTVASQLLEPARRRETTSQSNHQREPTYYGSTSTLFDDPRTTDNGGHEVSRMPPEWVKKGLLAEATRQRQIETINYNSGKLNFDGVDPDLGLHLLSLHWARQHHSFLVTYRPAFMRDMACAGPYFSKLLLNAIYFGAAKFSPRLEVRRDPSDVRTAGWLYRKRVKELLGDSLDKSDITTIQALLVMTNSLFALGDERSAAWIYAGIALRMIVDLGMHVDIEDSPRSHRMSDEDLEIRRRVFWAAFVIDKIQSLYQGRPVSLQYFDARAQMTFLDEYEEFEQWMPFAYPSSVTAYPGSPAYSVSTFIELCKLSILLNRVLNNFYSEKNKRRNVSQLINARKELHADIVSWRAALPKHLDFDPNKSGAITPPPHVLSLLTMYNVILIILHRPFVSEIHLRSENEKVAEEAFYICSDAATAITQLIRVYDSDFSIKRAPYLIAYAVYVAATIHVRVAAQLRAPSNSHFMLQTCLRVLDENTETNWAVRKARIVITALTKRMGVKMPQEDPEAVENNLSLSAPISQPNLSFFPDQNQPLQESNPHTILDRDDRDDEINASIQIDEIIKSFSLNRAALGYPSNQNDLVDISGGMESNSNVRPSHNNTTFDDASQGEDFFSQFTISDELFGFNASPGNYLWTFDVPFDGGA